MRKILPYVSIPQYTFYEFEQKCHNKKLKLLKKFCKEKYILLEDIDYEDKAFETFMQLKNGVNCQCRSKNESAAIALAKHSNYTLLTDNIDSLEDFGISTLTFLDLIINSYNEKKITLEDAEEIWKKSNLNTNLHFDSFEKFMKCNERNS